MEDGNYDLVHMLIRILTCWVYAQGCWRLHHDGVVPMLLVLSDEGPTAASHIAHCSYILQKWVQRVACLNPLILQLLKQDHTDNAHP
jgi:hypothetical protein